jgi:hypothetical protein
MRLLAVSLLVLGTAIAARAQDQVPTSEAKGVSSTATDVAPPAAANTPSENPSPSAPPSAAGNATPLLALATPRTNLAALSFSNSASGLTSVSAFGAPSSASPSPAGAADPAPASPSAYGFNERDYNLDIAFGIAVVRFRSPAFYATAVGPHVSAAFYLKDWLAVEGAITAAFAPSIYSDNVRYLGYAGGLKIPFSLGRRRLEPWAHALGGGVHVGPQTAVGSRNGFELTAGGGVDYALTPRVSLRIEADYLGSHMFSQWLNSGQGLAGVVFHF